MTYHTLLLETRGRVGLITLNRPEALNALNAQLIDELNRTLLSAVSKLGVESTFAGIIPILLLYHEINAKG